MDPTTAFAADFAALHERRSNDMHAEIQNTRDKRASILLFNLNKAKTNRMHAYAPYDKPCTPILLPSHFFTAEYNCACGEQHEVVLSSQAG